MSKKTEQIEIRMSPELKGALSDLAKRRDRSMSDLVRGMIDAEVQGTRMEPPLTGDMTMQRYNPFPHALRTAVFVLPVLALAATYLLSANSPVSASAEVRVVFAELDANRDGQVSPEEYARHLTQEDEVAEVGDCDPATHSDCTALNVARAEIAMLDSDDDGLIAFGELRAILMRDRAEEFLEVDADGNGFVTPDELAAVSAYWQSEQGEPLSDACTSLIMAETTERAATTCGLDEDLTRDLAAWDSDRDGQVSLLEFLAY